MSSISTNQVETESRPTSLRSISLNVKKKNKYLSPNMKVLMSSIKKKKIRQKIKELMPQIKSNFKTINITKKNTIEEKQELKDELPNINAFSSPNLLNSPKASRNKLKTINLKLNVDTFRTSNTFKKYSFRPPYKNFFKEYLTELTSQKEQSDSIFKALDAKKFSYLYNVNEYIHRTEGPKKKIKFGLSSFPMKNKNLELKITDPNSNVIILYNKCFHSLATGERYERHMKELLRLKSVIKNIEEKNFGKNNNSSFRMLANYLSQNGVFDKKYYNENYLSNFRDFLEIDFEVNPQVSFKIFLHEILNGKYDKYISNPMDSTNSSLFDETQNQQSERLNTYNYIHHKSNSEQLKKFL